MNLDIEQLQERLRGSLPGLEAQMRMAPPIRTRDMKIPDNVRLGGVLIVLRPWEKQWHTILIRRTEDGHTHSGQISFPGGKKDPQDPDLQYTALRECHEEIGVPAEELEVLGSLSPLFIPPSNFLVTPTLALLKKDIRFIPSEKEVAEIIQVPLSLLFDEQVRSTEWVQRSDEKSALMETPVYRLHDDCIIWGATAMMIAELEVLCMA